jgi:hypothetical protein
VKAVDPSPSKRRDEFLEFLGRSSERRVIVLLFRGGHAELNREARAYGLSDRANNLNRQARAFRNTAPVSVVSKLRCLP